MTKRLELKSNIHNSSMSNHLLNVTLQSKISSFMRLHRNLCFAVIDGILEVFNDGNYADKVIQSLLKRDKRWGSRDRGFVAETTYDIVRWKRLYAEIAEVKEPFSRDVDPPIVHRSHTGRRADATPSQHRAIVNRPMLVGMPTAVNPG